MNNSRRKTIARSLAALQKAHEKLQAALEEEKKALQNIPDDDDHEDQRDAIDELIGNLEEGISTLGDAIESLDSADF